MPVLFARLFIPMHLDRKINIVLFWLPEIVFVFSGISSLIVFNIPKFYYIMTHFGHTIIEEVDVGLFEGVY